MSNRVYRSINEPIRDNPSWDEKWSKADNGLIIAWEVGRQLAEKDHELTVRAKHNELPALGWKGGTEKATKNNEKYGTQKYLAKWQGLRGDDLDIDIDAEQTLICSKTGMTVIYTDDIKKYGSS